MPDQGYWLSSLIFAPLVGGALAFLPDGVRLALAFVSLVVLPGLAWLAVIGAVPPGGAWLSPGWALGLGVAWQAALVLATHFLGVPFTALAGPGAVLLRLLTGVRADTFKQLGDAAGWQDLLNQRVDVEPVRVLARDATAERDERVPLQPP